MVFKKLSIPALLLASLFFSGQVASVMKQTQSAAAMPEKSDMNTLLWTKGLAKSPLPSAFKGYKLVSDSNEALVDAIGALANFTGGKNVLDANINVVKANAKNTTLEFVFLNPAASGNRTTSIFHSPTFSLHRSIITQSINGSATNNKIIVNASKNKQSKAPLRIITETRARSQSQLLDATAPLIDQNTFLFLMQGANKKPQGYHNKPVYFFINGLVRKYKIVLVGEDAPNNPESGLKVKAYRFNLIREGLVTGTVWVASSGIGHPLRFEIGKLRYNIIAAK